MSKETITMAVIGGMSIGFGVSDYDATGHVNIMTIVMFVCSVGYFTCLFFEKRQ